MKMEVKKKDNVSSVVILHIFFNHNSICVKPQRAWKQSQLKIEDYLDFFQGYCISGGSANGRRPKGLSMLFKAHITNKSNKIYQ